MTLQKTAEELAALPGLARASRPRRTTPGWATRSGTRSRSGSWPRPTGSWWRRSPSGWGSTRPTSGPCSTTTCPKGPESYAQEIGRAGRDGQPARCELFACPEDLTTLENFAFGDTPTPEAVASLVEEVTGQGAEFDVSTYDLSQAHDVRPLVVQTLLTYLELEGIIEATGPFYAEYKFKSDRPLDEIVARFDPRRREFLARVFERATQEPDLVDARRPGRRRRRWASPGRGSSRPSATWKSRGS